MLVGWEGERRRRFTRRTKEVVNLAYFTMSNRLRYTKKVLCAK